MKPIYIKMSAFGSYAKEEIVEFTDVNHGIFLITGDTGAGKTTIFDAITYALYDETSGGKRDGEMMRSQYANEDTRTFVELNFIYNGETYTITRYPKQTRKGKKKNKDGEYSMTVDAPNVELIMPDGLPFKGKIKETNQKIVEIVGLDVNQFTQIAMIAQGDFLKLLHAPSKERKEIFSKIFNTKIYWHIEEELKTREKILYGKLEDNRKDIIREMENVACIENSAFSHTWEEMPRFLESDSKTLTDLVEQIIAEAKEKEEEIGREIKANQKELDKVCADIKQAEDINKLFVALESAQNKKKELEDSKEEMDRVKVRAEKARKAAFIEPKEAIFLAKQVELKECIGRITDIKEWLNENKDTLDKRKKLKEISDLEYKKKNPELAFKINKITELLPKYEQYEDKTTARDAIDGKKKKVQSELDEIIANINEHKERLVELISEQEALKGECDFMPVLLQAVEKLTEKKNALESLLNSIKLVQVYLTDYKRVEIEYDDAKVTYEEKTHIYEDMYHQFIEGQAGILAQTLTDGAPCPVCGSTSHPQKAIITVTSIGQKELQTAKKSMELAGKEQQMKYDALQQAKQKYENEKNLSEYEGKKIISNNFTLENVGEADIKAVLSECKEQLETETEKKRLAEKAKKKYDVNEEELKKLDLHLKTYDVNKEASEKTLKGLELRLAAADSEIKALKDTLIYESKEAAEGELSASSEEIQVLETVMQESAEKYNTLLNETAEKMGNLSTEEKSHSRLLEETKKAEEVFLEQIGLQGFINAEEYHSFLLTEEIIVDLNNLYQKYREEVIKNEESLKNYTEQTIGKYKIQTNAMEEQRLTLGLVKSKLEEDSKTVYGIRTRDEDVYHKTIKLLNSRQEIRADYVLINRLNATANGKLNQRHMNFQTYIQRKYFNYILKEANKRLYIMSNGQFILQCRDIKDLSGQGEVGLDLDVYSMVNDQARDVKTLSGGESFIAALAMALGMADIIQNTAGSIHIDTMFIDEGFGSLSEETRMQAINILNELSEGKRLVGIISHVTELKAQIDTKLVVTKGEKGSKVKWEIAG